MSVPVAGTTPLADLTTAYASVCAAIRDMLASPLPTYTLPGGVSVSMEQYYAMLLQQEEMLRKIPGVAPSTNPIFTATSVAR